jgi:hypothetical protein
VVVGHHHHIKIYDLAVPSFNLDMKDMGVKDGKVTCMEFHPIVSQVDRGFLLLLVYMPHVIRTTEKQDFVKMLDGKLWTAARQEHHGAGHRLPTIRIYDVFNPASTGRSVLPIEHVGPVRSATIIPQFPESI